MFTESSRRFFLVGRVFAIAQTRKLQIELRWQWLIGNKEGKSMRNEAERRDSERERERERERETIFRFFCDMTGA